MTLVTPESLGAWLLKGNADRSDLAQRLADEPRVDAWCVRPGYRMRLMAAGQPMVLWAASSVGRHPYGVWGVGLLTGAAAFDGEHWRVPLDLTALPARRRVRREELRADPRLADLEVFRQPQGANPSFLTVAQFAALRTHLKP